MPFLLFVLGISVGSFLNVVSLRYRPEKFLFGQSLLGRSHCPHCKKTLRWFELVPAVSFAAQGGRCRHCHHALSWQYPLVEILSGLIFVFVPLKIFTPYVINPMSYILSALWVLVFLFLLLISAVDFRLSIIPDEANIFLFILGVLITFFSRSGFGPAGGSFLGDYAFMFGLRGNVWLNHFFAALVAGLFFGGLIVLTRGRGMGAGDLKLALPLGFIFGWPDTALIVGLGFIIGSFAGAYILLFRKKTLKSAVPFGPFLAIASALVFFFGNGLVRWYFSLFGL